MDHPARRRGAHWTTRARPRSPCRDWSPRRRQRPRPSAPAVTTKPAPAPTTQPATSSAPATQATTQPADNDADDADDDSDKQPTTRVTTAPAAETENADKNDEDDDDNDNASTQPTNPKAASGLTVLEAEPGIYDAAVAATVSEEGGRSVSANFNVTIDTAGRHIGLHLPREQILHPRTKIPVAWVQAHRLG